MKFPVNMKGSKFSTQFSQLRISNDQDFTFVSFSDIRKEMLRLSEVKN